MKISETAHPSVVSQFEILKEKILNLHGARARELAEKLEGRDRATSIAIGDRLKCPVCPELQRVVKVKEDPEFFAKRAHDKSRGQWIPKTVVTLACGHERGEILPRKGISFEDVPSPEAERLFPVDWKELYKSRLFRHDGRVWSWL
jgi:hypothetical protein